MSKIIVSKFGGTSMGDYESMKRAAAICIERGSGLICVSATSGTTDKLIEIAKNASTQELEACDKNVFAIKERHSAFLQQVGGNTDAQSMLNGLYTELDLLVQNLFLLKELTPRAYDHILSLGERMSSIIFRQVLQSLLPNKNIELLDARSVIKTDSNFGKATPLIDVIEKECKNKITLENNQIYVTQSFIGSDMNGNTTILGRGGSDYSAALFAEGMHADVLEIWTDIAGIATTDPRLCKEAQIIRELSYQEAGEMAQYGAKILHPATMAPAVRKLIPVFVGSTFEKDMPGTWIKATVENPPDIRAITQRKEQALLTITTAQMFNAHGFMSEIFDIFSAHRISVDCVTTSEISVAITVDKATLENEKFLHDLGKVGKIKIESGYSLVSLIGNELYNRSTIAKNVFASMDGVNVRMMSLGASPYNFNFLVKDDQSSNCIKKLHSALIENV